MSDVILLVKGFYEHVIDVNFHGLSELFGEHTIHESLIGGSCVFEPKRHYFVAVCAAICDECSLFAVVRIHHDLIVS